jgi:hypothetical protein
MNWYDCDNVFRLKWEVIELIRHIFISKYNEYNALKYPVFMYVKERVTIYLLHCY